MNYAREFLTADNEIQELKSFIKRNSDNIEYGASHRLSFIVNDLKGFKNRCAVELFFKSFSKPLILDDEIEESRREIESIKDIINTYLHNLEWNELYHLYNLMTQMYFFIERMKSEMTPEKLKEYLKWEEVRKENDEIIKNIKRRSYE